MADSRTPRSRAGTLAWMLGRVSLDDPPAPELHPWGYWMEIDGAKVWTDDID